jgi:hypothetical protein
MKIETLRGLADVIRIHLPNNHRLDIIFYPVKFWAIDFMPVQIAYYQYP